jgi:hypothetical protein
MMAGMARAMWMRMTPLQAARPASGPAATRLAGDPTSGESGGGSFDEGGDGGAGDMGGP